MTSHIDKISDEARATATQRSLAHWFSVAEGSFWRPALVRAGRLCRANGFGSTFVFYLACLILAFGAPGLSNTAHASFVQSTVVYGPETFTRSSGGPSEQEVEFELPAGLKAPFELQIANGDSRGRDRVTSARVYLNDVQIAGPNDFGKRIFLIKRPVELRAQNTLKVRLAGAPESQFTVRIEGRIALPQPVAIKPDPLRLAPGADASLQVELSPPPRWPGLLYVMSSSPRRVSVQRFVNYAPGQSVVDIPVKAFRAGTATIRVFGIGGTMSSKVIVADAAPSVVALEPATSELQPNTASVFQVSISPVQAAPVSVSLESTNPQVASLPASVVVPAGALSASFGLAAHSTGNAEVKARLNGSELSATVTVRSQPSTLVSLSPITVQARPNAEIKLVAGLAAARNTVSTVGLHADTAGIVEVPPNVAIPAGVISAEAVIKAVNPGTVRIDANLDQSTVHTLVHVTKAPLAMIPPPIEPLILEAGATGKFEVRLNAVQPDNILVDVAAAEGNLVTVPATAAVAAGVQYTSVPVTAGQQTGLTEVLLTLGEQVVSVPVRIVSTPPSLDLTLVKPLVIQEGAIARLPLVLTGISKQDRVVTLSQVDGTAVQISDSATIPAGERSIETQVAGVWRGTSVIRATVDGVAVSIPVEVVPGAPRVSAFLPDSLSLAKGLTGRLRLELTHVPKDGVSVELSQSGAGRLLLPSSVIIPAGHSGIDIPVAAVSVGGVTLVAQANGGTSTAGLEVTEAVVEAITLSPVDPVAYVADTESFTATAYRSDGTESDVTGSVIWTSSDSAVVEISSSGVATAIKAGTTQIQAELEGVTAKTSMSVRAQPELTLTPAAVTIAAGDEQQIVISTSVAAGEGGLEVLLEQTGTGSLSIPTGLLIAEGEEQASFMVIGQAEGEVLLTAAAAGHVAASATVQVTAPAQNVSITGMNPQSGPEGTRVTLTGTGFDPVAEGNQVRFAPDVTALVVESSPSHLVVVVPPGAQTGTIAVTNAQGSGSSPIFTVERPFDIAFSASPAEIGLMPGGRVYVSLELTSTGAQAFEGLAAPSVMGLPDGVTASFEPNQLIAGQPGAMVLTAAADAQPAQTVLNVRATIAAAGTTIMRGSPVGLTVSESEGASITGRFVTPDGQGIAGVVVRAELNTETITQTLSDAAGSFALSGLPGADLTLKMDATRANPLYPIWPHRLTLAESQALALPEWTIAPPPADEHFTPINNATQDQVVVDERYPGLAITLPAGVKILGWDGIEKTRIAVERRPPEALPTDPPPVPVREVFHLNFGTPMGGLATQPIPVSIPNVTGLEPGEKTEIWYYDGSPMTNSGEWKSAGPATISADGMSVVSDEGYGLPSFCGVCGLFAAKCPDLPTGPPPAPPPPPPEEPAEPEDCNLAANPIELMTGYEMPRFGGLRCGGRTSREMRLSYNPFDAFQGRSGVEGAVGHGWVLDYDIVLADSNRVPESKRLLLPPNERINFARQADGTYAASGDPRFDGAVLRRWDGKNWELELKDGTRWRFGMTDAIGRTASFLIEILEPGGRTTRIERRSDRKITRIGDDNRNYQLIYGANNLVSEIRDSGGRQLGFTYTSERRIETITDADGGVTRYEYVGDDELPAIPVCPQSSDGLRVKRIHYPGMIHPTENTHGASRRVLRQTSASGIETRFEYEVVGACVTHVNNPTERCTGSQCPRIDSWQNYEAGWRIVGGQVMASTVIDGEGQRTTRRYNAQRLVTDITRADGQTVKRERNGDGRITRRTDALGRTSRYNYDDKGNLTRRVDPLGRITVMDYHATWGKPIQVTRLLDDGTQVVHQFQYDNATGNLTRYINPLGETKQFSYDSSGQLETVTDPLGHITRFAYNNAGDLTQIIDALGNVTHRENDGIGRAVSKTDSLGFETKIAYTELSQLDSVLDPLGGQTRQTYDAARRLTSVINARGNTIESYVYDEHGRLTEVVDALGLAEAFEYDGRNLVIVQRDRMNRVTGYDYDAQGRLNGVAYPGGDSTHIVRDALGRVTSVEDGGSRIDYSYDAVGRLISERTTNIAGTHEISYQWDALDRLIQRTVNGVDATRYYYDLASRLSAVEYRDTLTTYTWDAAGRLTNKTLANGIFQNLTWDEANRLTRIEYRANDASLIEAVDYQYDANGQRIVKASGQPGGAETPMQAQYDAADRMTQVTLFPGKAEEATYQLEYDSKAKLVRKANTADASDTTIYSWDSRGRLSGIVGPETTASFKYDALDRRIERTINGVTLRAIYDGAQLIGELAGGVVEL
tara:strand:- start:530 stop:7315 length:6786 start_codon:yes stop_codon:yes gene_type:complete